MRGRILCTPAGRATTWGHGGDGRLGTPALKAGRAGADATPVRLDRLVIDSGGRTLTARFHPRLTVIGGLTPAARDALVGELVEAVVGGRPGVHLELRLGERDLAVFRPVGGRHRVVDTAAPADVTDQHLAPDGRIDLLAGLGVDPEEARHAIRFGRDDLVLQGESEAWTTALATADQDELWDAATRCRAAEQLLRRVSAAAGANPDDAALAAQIEARHASLVEATDSWERVRLVALTLGTVGAIGAAASTQLSVGLPTFACVLVGLVGAVLGMRFRREVDRAEEAERAALAEAGADDYASFHFERVSALLDGDEERRRFMLAVSDHRRAQEAWQAVAGDAPLHFALDNEREIRATAELQHGMGSLRAVSATVPDDADARGAELARAVLARLDAVRALTPDTLPLVVDDPFDGLDPSRKPMLLEMLSAQAGSTQLILVTADEDVTSWARVEAMTGEVAVVEPEITATVPG